ncbi:MAG: hypothetical protein AAFO02_00085 [Bacteroidota bacterium]
MIVSTFCLLLVLGLAQSCGSSATNLPQPVEEVAVTTHAWRQPKPGDAPIWGHVDGLQIGIAPTRGPRGLLRLYAPYLGHEEEKMINFFALEPIVSGQTRRGFSELEPSAVDGQAGKIFISSNAPPTGDFEANRSVATGRVAQVDGVETLTIFIRSEPFANGAEVYVQIRFFADRPQEVDIQTFSTATSTPLDYLILTATMGNYARLRQLPLRDTVLHAGVIWPHYQQLHFTDHFAVSIADMLQDEEGNKYFIALPDEADPVAVDYAPATNGHWKYYGQVATQYWKLSNPDPATQGLVNGRYVYWASHAPIPGGISFENFEIKRPYRLGDTYTFGVIPRSASEWLEKLQ